ncbi:glycoside hydrolase family 44 protein [Fibrobacter sp.]|uniref:glycoside hydrolase family 44 protein n=1 Tax=Fibrobacter sp. TaxID=35828 RepID=UPI0038907ABB
MVIVKTLKFSGILAAIITAGISATAASAAINVNVDTDKGVKKISPYLYGRNIFCNEDRGDLNDITTTLTEKDQANLETYRQAGIRYLRMNNGNNATKHNWRKNLSSHPDYYNNVYKHDWDVSSKKILDNLPGVDGMYAFQLAGYVASSTAYNFKDWDWKQSHGGINAKQTLDLAGGGMVDDDGVTLIQAGDYRLYLEEWPADSTVELIKHWRDDLKYDMSRFRYWSMDNEMELWRGTHSDLPYTYPNEDGNTVAADRMVDNYIAVAKAAKAISPDLKLTGPVAANEWSWCNIAYDNESTSYVKATDRKYCWLEYFIKRLGDEQKKTTVQLLDVFDIHWYPSEKDYETWMNWHRVFFDTTYVYPGGNGIRCADISTTGSCDWNTGKGVGYKTYIFKRIADWMKKYMGENYKYTLGFTETDFIADMDAMSRALAYASFMGTFIDHGVEIFTPWTWREGMYEVVHLFSRYGHENRVQSTSSNDSLVSAYSSISNKGDSLTVIFVNRAEKDAQDVYLSLDGFKAENTANALTLSGIAGETFVSHTSNALKKNAVNVKMTGGMTNATENYANKFSLTLPAKSITAVLFTTKNPTVIDAIATTAVRPNYSLTLQGREILVSGIQQNSRYALTNTLGQVIRSGLWNGAAGATLKLSVPATGRYILQIGGKSQTIVVK